MTEHKDRPPTPNSPRARHHGSGRDHFNDSPRTVPHDVDSVIPVVAAHTMSSLQDGMDHTVSHWKILLFGQVLSFLFASQGAAQATLHLTCNLSAPTFATSLVYVALSFHMVPLFLKGRRMIKSKQSASEGIMMGSEHSAHHWFLGSIPLFASPLSYFGIALIDVEANFATIMAFRYTTLTSVAVFDAMAIPTAMILSRLFLSRRYYPVHLLGAAICLIGITANVFTDYESDLESEAAGGDQTEDYPNKVLGDFLAIIGGILFGVRDVMTEMVVRQNGDACEYLGMIGFFGTIISVIQVLALERDDVSDIFDSDASTCAIQTGILLLGAYVICNTVRYIGLARYLLISEAALLNLSLLTGDLWSAMFSVVAERIIPKPWFWVALILIIGGVFIYEIGPSPIVEESRPSDDRIKGVVNGAAESMPDPERALELPELSGGKIGKLS